MLEKEKIVQGIYVNTQDTTTWLESRTNAELCKKYGTGEDFSKNPRFKKIGESTRAHLENYQKNIIGKIKENYSGFYRELTPQDIKDIIKIRKNKIEKDFTSKHLKKQADYVEYIEEQEKQGAFKDNPFFNILETYNTFTKNDYT